VKFQPCNTQPMGAGTGCCLVILGDLTGKGIVAWAKMCLMRRHKRNILAGPRRTGYETNGRLLELPFLTLG
jgi:hypothetical protein